MSPKTRKAHQQLKNNNQYYSVNSCATATTSSLLLTAGSMTMWNRQRFVVLWCFVLGLWCSSSIAEVGVSGETDIRAMSDINDEDTYTFVLPSKRRLGWSQSETSRVERNLSSKSTKAPTLKSTKAPTLKSTKAPTLKSTKAPSLKSTKAPTLKSTKAPTLKSTKAPTCKSEKSSNIFC